jgi:long-chain acyl-CoA synthetase
MLTKNIFKRHADKTAISCPDGRSFTYHELERITSQISEGVASRSLVFSLSNNTSESLFGYLSFITNDIVPLMLDAQIDQAMLQNLIEIYAPEYVWLPVNRVDEFPKAKSIYLGSSFSLLKVSERSEYGIDEDTCLLLTTSGSTGSPKLVRLSYKNVYANAKSISEYLSITSVERPITTLPMSYSFGLSIINSHLIMGANILLNPFSIMEREFWVFLKQYKATSLSGVPYTFEMLKKLRLFNMNIPYMKTLTQAGGKLNNELNREIAEFCEESGKSFYVMYGQTEATARMSYLPSQLALKKTGSMGIAIPGGRFEIIDDNGQIITGHGKAGELVYFGENVCMGYAETRNDLQKGDENRGVLITGDIAKRDNDDYYYIIGRKKRFIKLFGNRVNLDETERLLKNIVSECACVGHDDRMIIYASDDANIDDIKTYISSRTGINPNGFEVRLIDRIPKNSSGKTIYAELKI